MRITCSIARRHTAQKPISSNVNMMHPADRIIAGLCTVFMRPARVLRAAIVLKPSTSLHLHSVLRKRKYRLLFSPERRHRPGPKGPKRDLIDAVLAMKRCNPSWGCPRIAQQIALAFGVEIDKDVVRRIRILNVHYQPELRYIDSTNGKLISGCSKWRRSRLFLTCRCHIPLQSD